MTGAGQAPGPTAQLDQLDANPAEQDRQTRLGMAYGALAFFIWGSFPLYFRALKPAGAIEILLHRIVWALLVCLLAAAVARRMGALRDVWRSGRLVGALSLAAGLIAVNWGVYIAAVNSGHVVEAALGYFINPLVTVVVGVVVLHERLRRLQWVAVGMGAVAVTVLTIDYGRPPWIALVLAFSFASYGLVKKQVGPQVSALASLTTETMVLTPFALAALVWLEASGRGTFAEDSPWHGVLLATAGVATTIPLVLFAAGSRRVPLSTMGLLQFITPVLQLLVGVLLLGEHVPGARWVGFGLVWVALMLLSVDSVRQARARGRARATRLMCEQEYGPQNV